MLRVGKANWVLPCVDLATCQFCLPLSVDPGSRIRAFLASAGRYCSCYLKSLWLGKVRTSRFAKNCEGSAGMLPHFPVYPNAAEKQNHLGRGNKFLIDINNKVNRVTVQCWCSTPRLSVSAVKTDRPLGSFSLYRLGQTNCPPFKRRGRSLYFSSWSRMERIQSSYPNLSGCMTLKLWGCLPGLAFIPFEV